MSFSPCRARRKPSPGSPSNSRPIFFAGVIFATEFRDSRQPGVDFGWNVAGVALGGLCENFSLVLGFQYLLGVAAAFYLLSAILRPRGSSPACGAVLTPSLPSAG